MAEKKMGEADVAPTPVAKGGRSLFAPLALIMLGVLFLLDNLNLLPPLNWGAALRFWPLALIFAGLNVLAVQFRRPLGTVLSLLVMILALGVFGYLLVSGSPDDALRGLGLPPAAPSEVRQETFALSDAGVTSAEIALNLGNYPTTIGSLNDDNLIAGTVWTRGEVQLEQEREDDGRLALEFGVRENPAAWLDPRSWGNTQPWNVKLSQSVPLELHVNAGNGATTAVLDDLTLTALELDSGNGALQATLPDGDYDIGVDSSNGSVALTLPGAGRQSLRVDSANGSVRLLLPPGVAARVEYDTGNGRLNVDERFTQVSGDLDEGVYETTGYDAAADGLTIHVDSGNGSVTIAAP